MTQFSPTALEFLREAPTPMSSKIISTRIPRKARYRQGAILGFACCAIVAVVTLGTAGAVAAFIFAPIFLILSRPSKQTQQVNQTEATGDKRAYILGVLSRFLGEIGHPTVALIVEIDDYSRLEEVYDDTTLAQATSFVQTAIDAHLTDTDITVHLGSGRFVTAITPSSPYNLEGILNTCTRIQHSLTNPALVINLPTKLTVSIGFAASNKLERPTAEGVMQAAHTALAEARRRAPGAVRAYSKAMLAKRASEQEIVKGAKRAFEKGEIFAYFQPQIDLSDGSLSGFEALTRWHHPERGIVSPAEFLPALEQAGLMQKLGDTMIKQAIQAMTFRDKSGLDVPKIGVNFSMNELRNPHLVDRVAMHLDVSGLHPSRLVIEVLETVIATLSDDDIVSNLAALSDLGCGIDLDDFGTGYASITNIKRFSVGRIKIDRSFVTGIDSDIEQRNMVSAILMMASRLGVQTLAEGVETKGEREALHQLGCQDAQGFQFARPMPLQETVDWAAAYFGEVQKPTVLSKRAS